MDIPIVHMRTPSPGAQALADALSIDRFTGLRIGEEMTKAFRKLHPSFSPVMTVIVDSRTMDELHPPSVDLWVRWAVDELYKWARNSLPLDRYEEHRGWLADAFPALLTQDEPWISPGELSEKTGLDENELRRMIRQLRRRGTVALGVCFQPKNATAASTGVLEPTELGALGSVAIALDHERISATARKLARVRPGQWNSWFEKMYLMKHAVPIWLHEQSHAVRGANGGELEEVSAQLDAYRACTEGSSTGFNQMVFNEMTQGGVPVVASCAEMMRRLSKTQPPIYGAIFRGF